MGVSFVKFKGKDHVVTIARNVENLDDEDVTEDVTATIDGQSDEGGEQ